MRVLLIGINHRTAPVALRETLAVGDDVVREAMRELSQRFAGLECVWISTCNRTELYVARPAESEPSADVIRAFIAEQTGADLAALSAASIHREQRPAVHHLLRVTAGLDAMAVGESQVLGQVRRAYERACDVGSVGSTLHRVFQQALNAAKQARKASELDGLKHSVSSVAVSFARGIFESFADKTVVGLGAGEITKVTLREMAALGPSKTWVVNRSQERAVKLADSLGLVAGRGGARPWEDLDEVLVEADVVLAGTAATEPVVTMERFKPLLKRRRHRPLFLIDLAVPRDVEAAVGTLPNVYLYNIDDLQSTLAQDPERRGRIEQCEAIVRDAAARCMGDVQHQDLGVLIRQLRNKLLSIGDQERERTMRKIAASGGDAEMSALIEEHTHRLINKVLHMPLSQLDAKDEGAPLGFYAAALRKLFGLEEGGDADSVTETNSASSDETKQADAVDEAAQTERVS